MRIGRNFLCAAAFASSALALSWSGVAAAANPGGAALTEHRQTVHSRPDPVQNRFFLKTDRFEIAPMFGYVPNNPFAKRYVGGLLLAYHFSEVLAAEGSFSYSPDLGQSDLKSLTYTLINIAHTGASANEFVQPLDKVTLAASFDARWSPLYGKINLVGEAVVNFDFYGVAGLGIVSKTDDVAKFSATSDTGLELTTDGIEVKPTPVLGVGMDFFVNQSVAFKIDARSQLYIDNLPDYHPDKVDPTDGKSKLYNNFVASVGASFYFPKMKPRLYNF